VVVFLLSSLASLNITPFKNTGTNIFHQMFAPSLATYHNDLDNTNFTEKINPGNNLPQAYAIPHINCHSYW